MTTPYPFSAVVGLDDLRLALLLTSVSPAVGGVLVRGEKGTAKSTVRGDVVRVEGNPGKRMELDNGYGDWNLSWSAWKAGSALT